MYYGAFVRKEKMDDPFVGRLEELTSLSSLWGKRSASLVVVRGRRRIGKSRLIEEFAKDKSFFTFAGIPPTSGTQAQTQRDIFAEQLGRQCGLEGVRSQDWSTLFSLLAKHTAEGQVIILFDEISWMGSEDPLFLGKLKNAWDLKFKKNPNLILVLCGSVSTWIETNIISSTAFFGRISLFLKLEELPLQDCHQLLLARGFRASNQEEFRVLGVTGGIPWYLEQVQSGKPADETIKSLCFRKEGLLFNEFDSIFHDLFEKRSEIYRPIVEALANGAKDFSSLCDALKYPKSGTLSEYLNDLIQAGFISRDYTWSIKSGHPSKLSQFRLSDNYLRFYLKFTLPNKDRINRNVFSDQALSLLPGWHSMMGLQFENLVLNNRRAIWKNLGIRSSDIVMDNPYFQRKTASRNRCQIDYLIQTRFNTLFACEIKFSNSPLQIGLIDEMKSKLACLSLPKHFSCWPVLVHVNGVSDGLAESQYFTECIDFSDFLRAPKMSITPD